ncbi:hypothetical protein B0H34DRAFT_183920 [Crassisporium funariophilum]|nr:hypothetical protein B0H34DRAFT_183920 [Crassisporium funariophilum]
MSTLPLCTLIPAIWVRFSCLYQQTECLPVCLNTVTLPLLWDTMCPGLWTVTFMASSLLQCWRYCHNNNDGWTLRLLVFVSLILATTSTAFKLAIEHYFLVDNFGDIEILKQLYTLINIQYLISGVIFWMVHIFFASRLFLLLKSWWIPSLLALLSTTMLACNAYTGISPNQITVKISITAFHVLSVFTDVLVTLSFSFTLSRSRDDDLSSGMSTVLNRLIFFITTRGILLTVVQIAHLAISIERDYNVGHANLTCPISATHGRRGTSTRLCPRIPK